MISCSMSPPVNPRRRPARRGLLGLAAFAVLLSLVASPTARADTLGEALDAPSLTWTTGGDAPWFYQTTNTHDGVDAAQSGTTTNYWATSWLETSVTGRVTVLYWWRISSDPTWYTYQLNTNGNWASYLYDKVDWQLGMVSFGGGSNLLRWTYTVPGAGAPGWQANAAWLDQVVVTNITGLKPTFIVPPPSAINAPEYATTSSNLTATVIGDIPITYQWQRSGTNLSEAWPFYNVTSPSLTYYPRTQTETGGDFRLVASNAWGLATSTVCTVTIVPSPPIIPSYYPPDSLIAVGANAGLSLAVYGSPPFSYQWLKSGNPIPGSTQYYHPLWSATFADSGGYSVVVTNLYGAATSRVAQVTVSTALPSILSGPDPEVSEQLPGAYASFWAQVSGPEPIAYSWHRVGDPAELGNSSSMAISSVDPTNSGLYQLILTNQNGAVTSRVSVLAVAPVTALALAVDAPQLTVTNDYAWNRWLVDVTGTNAHDRLCAARSPQIWDWNVAPFSTVVTGPTNVSFWWHISAAAEAYLDIAVDGVVSNSISGETAWRKQSLALESGEHTLTWTFRKQNAGSVGADAAWVDQFAFGDGSSGNGVLLTNFTTGGGADWYLQATNTHASGDAWQSGLISDYQQTWLLAPVTGPGKLSFWWMVSSEACCDSLELYVDLLWQTNLAGQVAWQQVNLPLGPGEHLLEWRYSKDGSGSDWMDAGWVAEATFTPDSATPPSVVTDPVGGTYPAGSAITLTVSAEGSPPLNYQWFHDDVPITGAVTATNAIPYAMMGDAGAYYVTVANGYGSVTSAVATLTIYPRLIIVSPPTNVTVGVGGTAQFSVSATGAAPLSYAWYKDGWISGATSNTLRLTSVQTTNAGTYSVVVNDAYGNQEWASATLTVSSPPVITAQPVGGFGFSGSVILSSVTATGTPPLVFRWQRGGSDVPGATSNVLKIVNAQPGDSGSYRALVSNAAGSVTSLVATITITNPPPGAAPGTLDTTFLTGLGANGLPAERVGLQSDGKAILAGRFTSVNGVPAVGLARINPDGTYDPTFVTTGLDGGVRAVVVLPDDRILIAGYFTQVQGVRRHAVARLLPNGVVDPTFDPGAGPNDSVTCLAVQADGKVLVGGYFDSFSGVVAMKLARLQTNGVVDPTFISTNAPEGRTDALAVQPDGKILLGGDFTHLAGASRSGFARVHANGLLDTGFVPALTAGPQAWQQSGADRILVLPDNRILAAGELYTSPSQPYSGLLRFETNGALDPTFQTTASRDMAYTALCRQPDGKLLVSSIRESGTYFYLTFARRLSANGVPDPSFQPTTNILHNDPILFSVADDFALRPDGRLLAVGDHTFVKTVGHQLAQFQTNGVVDPTFLPGKGSDLAVLALAPRPDGRLVVGGDFTLFNHRLVPRVARLNADASLDPSFVTTEGPNNSVRALGVQSDERVVLGGTFTAVGSNVLAGLARLNADGSFNAAFQAQLGPTSVVNTLLIQPDDKIVLGGQFNLVNGSVRSNLARLEASGALDSSFLGTGFNAPVTVILRQADGKLLVAGSFTNVMGVSRLYLARLNDNGSLDAGFNPGTNAPGPLSALALAPDGKIMAAGSPYLGARNRIARLNPDGSADPTFGGYGIDDIHALAVQPDGRILVLGSFRQYWDANEISKSLEGIARLNADGSVDPGFDLGGVGGGGGFNFAAVAQLPDGRLLIGGKFTELGGVGRDNLARVNTENFAGLPPRITTQPNGSSRVAGSPWAMEVTASGSLPLAYQWRKNGVALANATGSVLTFAQVVPADTGEYDLVVTNAYGATRSFLARLDVAPLVLNTPKWDPARGMLWLTWNSSGGVRYRVERWNSPDLGTTGSPAWVLLGIANGYDQGGSSWGIAVPPGSVTGFYRVVPVP